MSRKSLIERLCGCKKSNRGQDLIEFAVMLPLLMIVLFGVIDLGRVLHASITIANASRTGARFATSYGFEDIGGVINFDTSEISARTQAEAQNSGISLNSVTVSCVGSCAAWQSCNGYSNS